MEIYLKKPDECLILSAITITLKTIEEISVDKLNSVL